MLQWYASNLSGIDRHAWEMGGAGISVSHYLLSFRLPCSASCPLANVKNPCGYCLRYRHLALYLSEVWSHPVSDLAFRPLYKINGRCFNWTLVIFRQFRGFRQIKTSHEIKNWWYVSGEGQPWISRPHQQAEGDSAFPLKSDSLN